MDIAADKTKSEKSNVHTDRTTLHRALKRVARRVLHPSDLRIISSFPMFSPASAGFCATWRHGDSGGASGLPAFA